MKYTDALTWYKLSQRLVAHSVLSDQCLAKLHRNLASTYLCLNELNLARDELERAEKLDGTSPNLFYLQFKLAILQNNEDAGNSLHCAIVCLAEYRIN